MAPTTQHITVTNGEDLVFCLASDRVEYRFHVDSRNGDLIHDHFGSPTGVHRKHVDPALHGWNGPFLEARREFPDLGRGDFRLPAVRIRHGDGRGHTTTSFKYQSHSITEGKPKLAGLPHTFSTADGDVSTVTLHLVDDLARLSIDLMYSIFPAHNAIVRSFEVKNEGDKEVTIERAYSFSVDMEEEEWDMVYLSGDWTREGVQSRQRVHRGIQGFQSSTGYSSHYHNPFVSLVRPDTTDQMGAAYGWSFVYSGSFSAEVEKAPGNNRTRVLLGLNPLHLSRPLAPGETFTTPEVCAVYEPSAGLNGMSRSFHNLYRKHLSRSSWTHKQRPVLVNNWEATYFDFNSESLLAFGKRAADLGIKMFVMDDGWFGDKKPRVNEHAGLGDWVPNPRRFPNGLGAFVNDVTALDVAATDKKLRFGIWVEPEMVNPDSELYDAHPDWILHAGDYPRTTQRNQLVLDLGKRQVQDYIIDSISKILSSGPISYVKWDNNRGMHEVPSPSAPHAYMLGLYRVIDTLTTRFPDVLWEGCASGGGRFDPGLLYYWPQSWTSDDTDAYERLAIQFGTSLVYPPSSMGCHVSASPNHQVGRTTPMRFRAHVALMGGSFGFELDLGELTEEERAAVPSFVDLAERVNPYVIHGDLYRLAMPESSNWPAAMYLYGSKAVVLAYQARGQPRPHPPALRLQGLAAEKKYSVKEEGGEAEVITGASLMTSGLWPKWHGDYDSKVYWVDEVDA